MSRTLPTTVASAIASDATRPVYLVQLGSDTIKYAATWDANITWNGQTWESSGVKVSRLTSAGGRIELPTGESDPWLALVMSDGVRGRSVSIYEHHYDSTASPQTDAVLVFTGIMDGANISDKITITVLESSRSKVFPPDSIEEPTFTYLLTSGTKISWGDDTITVT